MLAAALIVTLAGVLLLGAMMSAVDQRDAMRIRPCEGSPRYWQYKGKPVVLLGGTVDDNLFQVPDLEAHLDLLQRVGGNYVRNTMSDRPDLGYEVKAFKRLDDGRYDLTRWNDEYWQRFRNMLGLTAERDIIVQVEVWDRFDHSTKNWDQDPFNPKNNVNYTHDASGLAESYPEHPGKNRQPFFYTVPKLRDNRVVLPFQQRFVDRMLDCTLKCDHVLYCMDNETSGSPEWSAYWADYIRDKARAAGVTVELTEMWDKWDVRDEMHRPTFDHPERYTFVDISQNSQTTGQANWDHAQWVRAHLAKQPRPINEVKIYGADTSKWLDRGIHSSHGKHTFWRNLIGGFAASRFHRPPSGLGLSETARTQLRSARLLLADFDLFRAEPDSSGTLLSDRREDAAFLTRIEGEQYAVYFTDGGGVSLNLREARRDFRGRWLDVDGARWRGAFDVTGGDVVSLRTPDAGQWVALLQRTG